MNKDYRDQLLELIADGYITADQAVLMLVKYMSQDDVRGCMQANEILNTQDNTLTPFDTPYVIEG